MAKDSFKVKKSINLEPGTPTMDAAGDISFNSGSQKLSVRDSSATRSLVTEDGSATLTGKTISAGSNTISGLAHGTEVDNASTGVHGVTGAVVGTTDNQTLSNKTASGLVLTGQIDGAASTNVDLGTSNTATTVDIGSGTGANTINLGGANSTVNFYGTVNNQSVTNLNVTDKLITINDGGAAASGGSAGFEIEEDGSPTGYVQTSSDRNSFTFKAPNTAGVATLTPGGSADDVVLRQASQTLTNKTLTAPSTDVVTLDGQASAPANPSSGNYKMYVSDSTQKLTILDSAGAETTVGGGVGGINYIDNPDAEAGTTGWATYADAAGTRPVDGTGGSANITLTASASSPLRGTKSFLITKDAANRQGEGISFDFDVDAADQGKVLTISFDYTIVSGTYSGGTSSTDSDLICYIYRTDATARLIEPTPFKLDGAVVGVNYSYKGEFQTDSDANSYRVILHCATTSTSAFTFKFDNFSVGPQQIPNGTPITDWTAFTPTGSWTSNTTYTGFKRRVGDTEEYSIKVAVTGAPTAASLTLTLPSTIDTAKLTSPAFDQLGAGVLRDSDTANQYPVLVRNDSATTVAIVYGTISGSVISQAGNAVNATSPMTFATGDNLEVNFSVPIVGWSSNTQMSSDADTRVVSFYGTQSAGTSCADAASTIIPFTSIKDSHGKWSTNTYTVPVAGDYNISTRVLFGSRTWAVSDLVQIRLVINGSDYTILDSQMLQAAVAVEGRLGGSTLVPNLKAGDTISIYVYQNNAANVAISLYADTLYNTLSIERVSGPSQIAASETVAMRYGDSSTTLTNNATVTIAYSTKTYDTHGSAYNTSTGIYTVPVAGKYSAKAQLTTAGFAAGATDRTYTLGIVQAGSVARSCVLRNYAMNTGTLEHAISVTDSFDCRAGDTLKVEYSHNMGATPTVSGDGATTSFVAIERIGI